MSHVPTVLKADRSVFDKMLPVDDNDLDPKMYVTPKNMTPKNIHNFIIPQKIFNFLKTPQNIEIQNFQPQKMVRPYVYFMKISEYPTSSTPHTFAKIFYVRILELPNILRHQFCCVNEIPHTSGCEMIKEMEL